MQIDMLYTFDSAVRSHFVQRKNEKQHLKCLRGVNLVNVTFIVSLYYCANILGTFVKSVMEMLS